MGVLDPLLWEGAPGVSNSGQSIYGAFCKTPTAPVTTVWIDATPFAVAGDPCPH